MKDSKFTWVPIFNKIAKKLMEFRNDRKKLVDIMYEILEELDLFNDDADKNCNFDKYKGKRCKYDDFDPFSFMNRLALYNFENRKKFIQKFEEKTKMKVAIPNDFDGVPSVRPQLSCMISFKDDREKNDIEDFWNLFEAALRYPNDKQYKTKFIKYYDICVNKPLCKFNLSSCLFRMNGNYYISLDSVNRDYLKTTFNIDIRTCPSGSEYLELLDDLRKVVSNDERFNSFIDLSYEAWLSSKKVDAPQSAKNRVWLYSPGENAMYWDDCIKNNEMYIGWDELGDLKEYVSSEEIYQAIKEKYNEENPKMSKCACSDFANVLAPGDIVIAKKGLDKLLGYGVVCSYYRFDKSREHFKHVRKVEWKKIGEWINNTGTRNPIKTLTEISQYEGYPEELLKIMDGGENKMPSEWMIPANPKYYDHEGAFEKLGFIDWSQNANYDIGDIVYIYTCAPESRISFQSVVEKIDMTVSEIVDDSEFIKVNEMFKKRQDVGRFVRLKMVKKLDDPRLSYENLVKHGLSGRPQSAIHISEELSIYIKSVINEEENAEYTRETFLKEVFIDESAEYDKLCDLLERKKNIILTGSPGVGKTFMAKRLAYSIIGRKAKEQILSVQFHQSFSYEDFIEGIRPKKDDEGKFIVTPGMFYEFVENALNNSDKNYYVIIDEINRGNLSKIFGELMKLIEADKRYDFKDTNYEYVILPYSRKEFKIPKNIYIIGTMNTADRSLAMVDYALRRRFAFYHVLPKFNSKKFKEWLKNKNDIKESDINEIITRMNKINSSIDEDLGDAFEIGHSYFVDTIDPNKFKQSYDEIIEYEIMPLIEEYFIDEDSKIADYKKML